MRPLVLGLGNPLRGDDGIGIHAVNGLASDNQLKDLADFEVFFATGIHLLPLLTRYEKVICVDSVQDQNAESGMFWRLTPPDIPTAELPLRIAHGVGFHTVLNMTRQMGFDRPREATIFLMNIEKQDLRQTCSEGLSPSVQKSLLPFQDAIKDEVRTTRLIKERSQ